jgi:putative endonuclease
MAEMQAIKWLKNQKYKILFHRYKTKYGEIDIIAQKDDYIIFFEVKKRKNMYDSHFAINPLQQQRIIDTANYFIQQNSTFTENNFRFDALLLSNKEVIHYQNIFQ